MFAFDRINEIARTNYATGFKDAVYTVENTYWDSTIDKSKFDNIISQMALVSKAWGKRNLRGKYNEKDSANFNANISIFRH